MKIRVLLLFFALTCINTCVEAISPRRSNIFAQIEKAQWWRDLWAPCGTTFLLTGTCCAVTDYKAASLASFIAMILFYRAAYTKHLQAIGLFEEWEDMYTSDPLASELLIHEARKKYMTWPQLWWDMRAMGIMPD